MGLRLKCVRSSDAFEPRIEYWVHQGMTLNFLASHICRELAAVDNVLPPKATDDMVVDHSGGLHMRVADCGADKLESALLQVFTERIRLCAGRRVVFEPSELMHDRLPADEAPNVCVEAAELRLNFQETLRVVHSCTDLLLIADDAGIVEQQFQLLLAVSGDLRWLELSKGFSVSSPLAQNGVPAQTCLSALQG